MRIAFDSRPATDPRGIGRCVRCLLAALRTTAGEHEVVEQHRSRDDLAGLLAAARRPAPAPPAWTWEDAARATWTVYAEAATMRS
jgi:hypothetical protein